MFAVALSTLPVRAEAYPARSVRIIVPNEPGGIYDLVARLMATELSKRLPQRFYVENKPGAGSILGTQAAARAANALAIARQIAADPAVGAEVERIEALRQVVRDRLPSQPLPPYLRAKIEAAIGQTGPKVQPSWRALAASVAFAVALASGSTWVALRPLSDDRIAEAVVDSHLRALMAPQPTDVISSEGHTVKPWFNGRIPQSPQVVDLTKEGFPLVGARIDVIDAAPVATLVYGRRLHLISLLAMPAVSSPRVLSPHKAIKGYNLVQWSHGGVDYWAASDLNAGELDSFAHLFRTALSGS